MWQWFFDLEPSDKIAIVVPVGLAAAGGLYAVLSRRRATGISPEDLKKLIDAINDKSQHRKPSSPTESVLDDSAARHTLNVEEEYQKHRRDSETNGPFDRRHAAKSILSGLVKGYAQRIAAAQDKMAATKERASFKKKMKELETTKSMPPKVFDLYIDESLKAEAFLERSEFIQLLGQEKMIKSWNKTTGLAVVDWLKSILFEGP